MLQPGRLPSREQSVSPLSPPRWRRRIAPRFRTARVAREGLHLLPRLFFHTPPPLSPLLRFRPSLSCSRLPLGLLFAVSLSSLEPPPLPALFLPAFAFLDLAGLRAPLRPVCPPLQREGALPLPVGLNCVIRSGSLRLYAKFDVSLHQAGQSGMTSAR